MINYFRREFGKLFLSVIVIICIYNSVNLTFFNEKSVTKIFEMNENISLLNKELLDLQKTEKKWGGVIRERTRPAYFVD